MVTVMTGELESVIERERHVADLAARVLDSIRVPNTVSAFGRDWVVWSEYCVLQDLAPETVSADLLTTFAAWLTQDTADRDAAAPETITRRITGVIATWKRLGFEVRHGISSDARAVVRAYEKWLAENDVERGRGQAPGVTVKQLRQISEALPDTLAGMRDRSMLVLGFAVASRRAELARLKVSDVTDHEAGIMARIRAGKTGTRRPAILYGSHPLTCPVRTWKAWRDALVAVVGDEALDGQAYRSIDRHGNVGPKMSPQAIGDAINRAGRLIGVESLVGHSLRAGFVTEATLAGHDPALIADQGGWKRNSRSMHAYRRIAQQWKDNPLVGIGL